MTIQQLAVSAERFGRDAYRTQCLDRAGIERLARETFPSELERNACVAGWNKECWEEWGRGPNA